VWGHRYRAALTWLGPDAATGVDPTLSLLPAPIDHDQDAASPRRTRLTPAQVRAALHEYLHTGTRPNTITWIG